MIGADNNSLEIVTAPWTFVAPVVYSPTSGVGVTVNATSGNWAVEINGNSASGGSYGLLITAGTTAADTAFDVRNQPATSALFTVGGTGIINCASYVQLNGDANAGLLVSNSSGTAGEIASVYGVYGSGSKANLAIYSAGAISLYASNPAVGAPTLTLSAAATTGAKTASFTSTNKPGTTNQTTPASWLPVTCGTTLYYIPLFIA
jgi:hypothetical protein